MVVGPPLHIPAERLFRLLLRVPRASWPVSISIAGPSHGGFFVLALDPYKEAEAYDFVESAPASLRQFRLGAELTSLALHDSGGRVFENGQQLLNLVSSRDAAAVIGATMAAINVVSPCIRRIDYAAWFRRLVDGAEKAPEFAIPLAYCVDGYREVSRPDRYFGLPMNQLTDGQWLAFRAARYAYAESKS